MSNPVGRPTKITPKVVSILVDCFHSGMTVREACLHAVISPDTYYSHARKDQQFSDIMDRAQTVPTTTAKMVVVDAIHRGDLNASKWWLERKAVNEFGRNLQAIPEPEYVPPYEDTIASMSDKELVAHLDNYYKDTASIRGIELPLNH